ncbi:MAG: type II toxin-antitoxin system prevent-host-death family antitoxin [Thermomicrobiales bacterium]
MIRTLSSNEVKQQWGSIMNSVGNDGDEVIVESHGKPKVVVIPFDEFEAFQKSRKEQIRKGALMKLQAWDQKYANRNSDLSEQEVEQMAHRFRVEIGESFEADDTNKSDATNR